MDKVTFQPRFKGGRRVSHMLVSLGAGLGRGGGDVLGVFGDWYGWPDLNV